MSDPMTEQTVAYIQELFKGNSGGHDLSHTLRVYRTALAIADREADCDRTIVKLGALLHDADDHKLFQTENNANARTILDRLGISAERTEAICAVINSVSFSQNRGRHPGTLEGRIVQDADRLDAIGAVGIARTFAYGGENGRSLEDSLQHFDDKLLLLKDEMNTDTGRKLAEERHAYMVSYLEEYKKETEWK